ncbi:oxamate carbamoyltransferase subunit AllG family protein [Blastococcus sp. PRF04-17]|uniref:oxamate carbamoyltransferase subunit AllG family protein n=1 Tax=Blastococcus sp. PRF04-17 TaxID=2933797 RepID=UPI001FF126EE|nr:DUF1116 domain-containing protein [Blastococcus sp. PRF04-17]UOX99953.1 DUF1116 domain-containing protein [Blastococcus sp. PRF04-17]
MTRTSTAKRSAAPASGPRAGPVHRAAIASARGVLDASIGAENATPVTAMAYNGVESMPRVAGRGDRWFTALTGSAEPAGFGAEDASPELGGPAIIWTLGSGGFAMTASPVTNRLIRGTPDDALATAQAIRRIRLTPHRAPLPPSLDFVGSPSGVDVLEVLDTGIVTDPRGVFAHVVQALTEARDAR